MSAYSMCVLLCSLSALSRRNLVIIINYYYYTMGAIQATKAGNKTRRFKLFFRCCQTTSLQATCTGEKLNCGTEALLSCRK